MAGSEDDAEIRRRYMRWTGDLQESYLECLGKCGGLHEARPKTLLDMLQPRFPFLTLQNVKNHLQKQRTKESKAASGLAPSSAERARRGGRSGSQTASEEDLDDADPMDSEMGAPNRGGAGGGVTSAQAAAAAGPVPPRVGAGAPTLWLPDNWAAPPANGAGVQPNSLVDLAKRALALTVHQLALYRKLLEELEAHEEDHTLLVAALREDPSGQTVVLEAQRGGGASAAGGGSAGTTQGSLSGSGGSSEESRPMRLRRLLARLLPPNPFSSGPKSEAAIKLAAWIAAVSRDAEGGSVSAGSHLGGAGDVPPGFAMRRPPGGVGAAAGTGPAALLGAVPPVVPATSTALAGPSAGTIAPAAPARRGGVEGKEADDDLAPGGRQQRRRKRHKPLSELLAEMPLHEPLPAERLAAQAALPSADQVQQMLQGGDGGGALAPAPGGSGPLGDALSLLLQQHLQQGGAGGEGSAGRQGMEMDDDSLMLRALDAQMSSLLLQSVSNALLRSAHGGSGEAAAMDTSLQGAGAPGGGGVAAMDAAAGGAGADAGLPTGFDAVAALAAAGHLQLPPNFQDPVDGALGDELLPTGALDISVLRSFLDMLSSGGLSPLTSGGLLTAEQAASLADMAAGAAVAAAPAAPAPPPGPVPPLLSVAATGLGGSGSGGSGIRGGAFSAFKPTGSGSGDAMGSGGALGSGGAAGSGDSPPRT